MRGKKTEKQETAAQLRKDAIKALNHFRLTYPFTDATEFVDTILLAAVATIDERERETAGEGDA